MTDKENIRAEIERRIYRNKRNKVFEEVPEKRHQLIIEGQLLGELKHFIDSMQEEPVSEIDFEQELYKYFGQVKDFTLGMRIAKRFYEIGRNYQEPVSEGLEEAATDFAEGEWEGIGHCAVGYPACPIPEAAPRRDGRILWIE